MAASLLYSTAREIFASAFSSTFFAKALSAITAITFFARSISGSRLLVSFSAFSYAPTAAALSPSTLNLASASEICSSPDMQ